MQNLIERAVILSPGSVLQVPLQFLRTHIARRPNQKLSQTLAAAERDHILATLKECDWVLAGRNGAATRLGINRATLQFRMKKLGIVRPSVMWVEA